MVQQARAECATRATGAAEEAAEKARRRLAAEAPSEEAGGIYAFVRQGKYSDQFPRVPWLEILECIGNETFPLSKPFMIGREHEAMAQQLGHSNLLKVAGQQL